MTTSSLFADLEPRHIGLDNFSSYRDIQREALEFAADAFDSYRFVMTSIPGGGGKTLFGVSLGKLLGLRTAVCTATNGLLSQYQTDFAASGMVDIRGKRNYDCMDLNHLNCQSGSALGCRYLRGKGCSYEIKKAIARNAPMVSTNYAYWLNVNDKANGIERTEAESEWEGENPIELLILDEGHAAPQILSDYISCRIYEKDIQRFSGYPLGGSAGEDMAAWSAWAKLTIPELDAEIRTTGMELVHLGKRITPQQVEILHRLQALMTKLDRLQFASGDDWVVEEEHGTKYGRMWKFDSVFPGKYAEHYLFCGVPKVLVMTATGKHRTMYELGVKKENFAYKSWRRIFSAARNPIYEVACRKANGSAIRLNQHTPKEEVLDLIDWMNEKIIKPRLDRKGLIQTFSYERQRLIMDQSKYAKYMIGNTADPESESAEEVARTFRKAPAPSVLVGPSFSTGWDFPMDELEYIIIVKVPIEPAISKLMKARIARDESYLEARAMQTTEQGCFRGMRKEIDQCEVFLIDGGFSWFLPKNKHHAQDWFVSAIRKLATVPMPPKPLYKGRIVL